MSAASTLVLCRTRAHQRARLREQDGARVWTLGDLHDRLRAWASFTAPLCLPRDDLGGRVVSAEVLAADTANDGRSDHDHHGDQGDHGGGSGGRAAGARASPLPRLAPVFDELRRELVHAGTSAAALLDALGADAHAPAMDIDDAQGRRADVRRLLQHLFHAERALEHAGVLDDARALRSAAELLPTQAPPGFLRGVVRVEVELPVEASALEVRVLAALSRFVDVSVTLPIDPVPGRSALDGLDDVFRSFEASSAACNLAVTTEDVVGGGPLAPLRAALFTADVVGGAPAAVHVLDDEAAELRFVAGAVAACRAREPGCRVAVALRDTGRIEPFVDALVRHGVPVRRRRRPLSESPAGRLLRDVIALRLDGAPRDRLLSVLVNPARRGALAADGVAEILTTLRRAAARRDVEDQTRPEGSYRHRLLRLAQREPAEQRAVDAALRAIEPVLAAARRLPAEGTLAEHGHATLEVVRDVVDDRGALGGAEVLEVVARLQAAVQRVGSARGARGGAPATTMPLAVAARLLDSELQRQPWLDDDSEPDDDAVEVLGLTELCGRRFDHVVIARALEGELPLAQPSAGLLSDHDRRALNHALGRRALRLADDSGSVVDGSARRSLGREGAWWLLALRAARSSLLVTAPLHDGRGRERAPSAWLLDVARALGTPPEQLLAGGRAGAALDVEEAPRAVRVARAVALRSGVRAANDGDDDDLRVQLLGRVVDERARWFATPPPPEDAAPEDIAAAFARRRAPFAFAVDARRIARQFDDAFGLRPERPLTPTRLEGLAACRMHGFVQHVLKLDVDPEPGNAIEARTAGTLAHGVLEKFYLERRARRIPFTRMTGADRARLAAIVDEVAAPYLAGGATGHLPALAASIGYLKRTLLRVCTTIARSPPVDDVEPREFELQIGTRQGGRAPELASVPLTVAPGRTLFVGGIIDRVDEGQGGRVVVDYKTMSGARVAQKASHQTLFRSHFQLPLYLRLLEHHRPTSDAVGLHGYLVSLKDAATSKDVGQVAELRARVVDDARDDGLARGIARVVLPILEGTLPPDAGQRCDDCRLQRVCRVPADGLLPADDGGGAGDDERPASEGAP